MTDFETKAFLMGDMDLFMNYKSDDDFLFIAKKAVDKPEVTAVPPQAKGKAKVKAAAAAAGEPEFAVVDEPEFGHGPRLRKLAYYKLPDDVYSDTSDDSPTIYKLQKPQIIDQAAVIDMSDIKLINKLIGDDAGYAYQVQLYNRYEKFNRERNEQLELHGIECILCCSKKLPQEFVELWCSHTMCKECGLNLCKKPVHGGYIKLFPECAFCKNILMGTDLYKIGGADLCIWYSQKGSLARKLNKNEYNCLCSKCDNIFIMESDCGDDITLLPTMCRKCFDETAKYDITLSKQCSWCKIPYILYSGCNDVTCPQCGHHTCHSCGEHILDHDLIHFKGNWRSCNGIGQTSTISIKDMAHDHENIISQITKSSTQKSIDKEDRRLSTKEDRRLSTKDKERPTNLFYYHGNRLLYDN
jgi:hypothetical protein